MFCLANIKMGYIRHEYFHHSFLPVLPYIYYICIPYFLSITHFYPSFYYVYHHIRYVFRVHIHMSKYTKVFLKVM